MAEENKEKKQEATTEKKDSVPTPDKKGSLKDKLPKKPKIDFNFYWVYISNC